MRGRWGRWAAMVLATLVSTLALAGFAASPASAAPAGTAYVVNAIAGTTAQVVVDGAVVRASAAPGSVVGPLSLVPGQHVIELRSGAATVVSARFSLAGRESLDVVAHRAADQAMTPLVTVFRNDMAPVG